MKPGDRLVANAVGRAEARALDVFLTGKNEAVKEPVEVTEKRTMNSKTFDLGGGRFHLSKRLMPVHFRADPDDEREEWKEVDLTLVETGKNLVGFGDNFYGISIATDRVHYEYASKRGNRTTITLLAVGGSEPDYSAMNTSIDGNRFTWHDVAPGVDMYLICRPGYAELFKVVKDETAARAFTWDVDEDDDDNPERPAQFVRQTLGKDESQDTIELANMVTEKGKEAARRKVEFHEEWTGRVSKVVDPETRRKEWRAEPVYPVTIDATVTENIGAGADDGTEDQDAFWTDSGTTLMVGHQFGIPTHAGFRFQTVAVDQASTINSATLTIRCTSSTGSPTAKIYADDVDDAAAWGSSDRPSQITRTTAFTSITPSTTGLKVYDVAAVVQEIVDRGGWATGNDMRFVTWRTTLSGTKYARWEAYENAGTDEAQLDIDYTAGGGGGGLLPRLGLMGVG